MRTACTDPLSGKVTMDVKTAVALHKLAGAWDTMRDARRVLRGKGLPASVKSRAAKSPAQVEPLEPA